MTKRLRQSLRSAELFISCLQAISFGILYLMLAACSGYSAVIETEAIIATVPLATATANAPDIIEPSAFCADSQPLELIASLQDAVRNRHGEQFAELVSPNGLYIALQANATVHLTNAEVEGFFSDDTLRDWGYPYPYDGTPRPILESLAGHITQLLQDDLVPENVILACNDNQDGLSTGVTLYNIYIPDYEISNFYSVMRPGAPGYELDWGAWGLGMEYWNGKPTLSVLSHYRWTT